MNQKMGKMVLKRLFESVSLGHQRFVGERYVTEKTFEGIVGVERGK